MAWGVLQDKHMAMPPGTAQIGEDKRLDPSLEILDPGLLKRDGDIILQPQPSDDVNDPLNWSRTWKIAIMCILGLSSGVTVALGPMITPGLFVIVQKFKVSPDVVSSYMIGLLAFWTGLTTFFTASGANIWGKRPFFVISTAILLGTCVWGFAATSFTSLAVMRTIQGMASAPLETLMTSTVSDLFFVHQRGKMLAIWGAMIGSGVLLGQIISGFIIQRFGPLATFGFAGIVYAILLPLIYFFVLESVWRPRAMGTLHPLGIPNPTRRPTWNEPIVLEEKRNMRVDISSISSPIPHLEAIELPPLSYGPDPKTIREPYIQRLALFRGRLSNDNFWKGVIKPIPLICYPAVIFSTVVNGAYFTFLIILSLLSLNIMTGPQYRLSPSQVGLTNIPLLIVAFICAPISGFLADWVAKVMARRNNGVFEPEFRLVLMAIATPLSTAAFFGFGIAVERNAPLSVLLAFGSLMAASVPFAQQGALTYVIDCHPKDANQAFVTIHFMKAIFTFFATSYVNGWYARVGPRKVFDTIAIINLAACSLTIPAYVYGKRFRSMVARSRIAQKL